MRRYAVVLLPAHLAPVFASGECPVEIRLLAHALSSPYFGTGLTTNISSTGNHEIIKRLVWIGKDRRQIHYAYALPTVRAEAYYCLSSASCVGQFLPAAGALLPLCEALRLLALTVVPQLWAAPELETLLNGRG